MGRIVELIVALNAAGGIAVTWSYFKMRRKREARRDQFDRVQRELDEAKKHT